MLNLAGFQGLDEELRVDTSEGQPQYLLVSGRGNPIKLSASAYHLVRGVHAGRSFEALAAELSRQGERAVSAGEVETAFRSVAERIADIDAQAGADILPPGFWLRARLIPARIVERIASCLAFAYHPVAALPLLAVIGVTFAFMLRQDLSVSLAGGAVWGGYLLFILSLLVHELGHASACARYGAAPSDIGFTLYLVYPAFYSDVTSAWRLRRWQRVVVDLGGTFFQFVVAGTFVVAYAASGWEPLKAAFVMIGYGALFSLNPVFRFDGYWVLADALGVTNLSRQPSILFRRLRDRLRGRETAPLPWPRWVILILAVYTPLAFLTWAWFVVRLVPFLIGETLGYPAAVLALARAQGTAAWREAGALLATTLLLIALWYGTWSLVRSLIPRKERSS
jgi:putative peptide zinc metalloprotease protein